MKRRFDPNASSGWIKKNQTFRASLEKIEQIGERQYKQAMKHMRKFNVYETIKKQKEEKIDHQCTFKPQIFTQSYRKKTMHMNSDKNLPERRLLEWGKNRDKKRVAKALHNSIELEKSIDTKRLNSSLERKKKPNYLDQHKILKKLGSTMTSPKASTTTTMNSYSQKTFFSKKTSHANSKTLLI